MFKHGPLYGNRFEIVSAMEGLPLETGDIVYSASDAKGPLGIPFGRLIQRFTRSEYSHATMILREGGESYAIDVSDWGTRKLRVIDWFDNWEATSFCVVRFRDKTPDMERCLTESILGFLKDDPSYDFNFDDPTAFYCTEAVKHMCSKCGLDLGGEFLVKEIVPGWFYALILAGNFVTKLLSKASLPTDRPIAVVGNEERGMLASPLTRKIFEYELKTNSFRSFA